MFRIKAKEKHVMFYQVYDLRHRSLYIRNAEQLLFLRFCLVFNSLIKSRFIFYFLLEKCDKKQLKNMRNQCKPIFRRHRLNLE